MEQNQVVLKDEDVLIAHFDPNPMDDKYVLNRKRGVRLLHIPTGIRASCSAHEAEAENRVSAKYELNKAVQAHLALQAHLKEPFAVPVHVPSESHWSDAAMRENVAAAKQALQDLHNGVIICKPTLQRVVEFAAWQKENPLAEKDKAFNEGLDAAVKLISAGSYISVHDFDTLRDLLADLNALKRNSKA